MRDIPDRPGARDLSDDAIQQVMEADRQTAPDPAQSSRFVRGDGMPEFSPDWAREMCAELRSIADALLHIHAKLDAIAQEINRRT